jgi:hypothetical protein
LTSTPTKTASNAIAFDFTSLAITAGACNGMRYIEAIGHDKHCKDTTLDENNVRSHCFAFQGQPSLCISTNESRCFSINAFATTEPKRNCEYHQLLFKPTFLPASLFMPSLLATTHDTLQMPQTSLSFPSLIQPHLAAATASRASGLLE